MSRAHLLTLIAMAAVLSVPAVVAANDAAGAGTYRTLTYAESFEFRETTRIDLSESLSCRDEDDASIRERTVTNRVPLIVTVDSNGEISVRYDGDDDDDGEIQTCIDKMVTKQDLLPAPEHLWGSVHRTLYFDSTYRERQRTRRGEIAALYTLSGVSAAVGIVSFASANSDERDMETLIQATNEGSPGRANLEQRPDRFRAAGWAMVGVSIASFVGGTLLYGTHRDIERRQNPTLVLRPGAPTGDLGLTLAGRF